MNTANKTGEPNRQRTLNLILARVTVAAAILLMAASFLLLIPVFADQSLSDLVGPDQTVTMTTSALVAACLISLAHTAVLAWGLMAVARLFGRFAARDDFSPVMGHLLRRFGLALLAFTLLGQPARTLTIVALTWHNPPGQHILSFGFGFSTQGVVFLLTAALLVALGHVMRAAARMADDHRQIV